jgi:hypothetical protein
MVTYDLFQRRYQEFCDPDYAPDTMDKDRLRLREIKYKIKSHLRTVLTPVRGGVAWVNSAVNLVFLPIKYARDLFLFRRKHRH